MIETQKTTLIDKIKLHYQSIIEKGCNKFECEYGIKNLSEEISKKYLLSKVLDKEYMDSLSHIQNNNYTKEDLEKHIELDKKDMMRNIMAGVRLGVAGYLISLAPELKLEPTGINLSLITVLGCYLGAGWAAVDSTISGLYQIKLRSDLKSRDS